MELFESCFVAILTYYVNICTFMNYITIINEHTVISGNLPLPVNWRKILGPFQNVFTIFFDMYTFGMSFYIISSINKSY